MSECEFLREACKQCATCKAMSAEQREAELLRLMRAASLHEGEPREILPIRRKAEERQVNVKSETARILEEKHAPRPPP